MFICRGGSRAAATSKMERFVIIVNDWKPLIITTMRSILDVVAALDLPLNMGYHAEKKIQNLVEMSFIKPPVEATSCCFC